MIAETDNKNGQDVTLMNINAYNKKEVQLEMPLEFTIFKFSDLLVSVAWLILLFVCVFVFIQRSEVKPIPVSSHDRHNHEWRNLHVVDVPIHTEKVVSCYYNTPSQQTSHQLMPSDIHPHLCTHINIAFARIINNSIYLDNEQYKSVSQVVLLKKTNPKLRVLLSIGGAGDDNGFPDMVVNHASRKTFIKSVKTILRNYSLDGIDLDWEFPAVHGMVSGRNRERQHFTQLLYEIRKEYIREKRDYLLTVAVAAPETIVNTAYDVDKINFFVDYVNIMTYDFHSFTKYTPFTGLNSPLYHRTNEQMYMASLNINYTVQMYLKKGLDGNKIVVGIPTYGHSFRLVNADNAGVGSPAFGYGMLGGLGFVNYPDICKFMTDFKNEVIVKEDIEAKVPYLHKGQEWVSFDTPQSAMEKARYIVEHHLRGAMIYSLNADDYLGVCDQKPKGNLKFPLAVSVKNALVGQITE